MSSNIIAAVDIWSYKIRSVIAVTGDEREYPHIVWIWSSFSNWIRKWNVVSIKDLIDNINIALEEAETISWMPIQAVYISLSNSQVESIVSKWVIAIWNKEITEDDIARVADAAQTVSLPQNKFVMEVIPRSYKIDSNTWIINPIWMTWIRLEVDAQIITAPEQTVKNLEKSVNQVWVEVLKTVPAVFASSKAVLTRKQKELWVLNIDIWASSTWISVYEEWVSLYSGSIPVWWESVTNDIAIWMRTSIDTAEKIKLEYWTVKADSVSEREQIDLSVISNIDTEKVMKKHLANIMKARYEEIFYMVKNELKLIWRDWMLPAWVVLTWWACKASWVVDMCKDILSLPVQIWFPQNVTSVIDKIEDPEYATLIWLVHYWIEANLSWWWFWWFKFNWLWDWFKDVLGWFKNLLPH